MNNKKETQMKDRDTSIYMAAHDLRAPLMSVKGLLNLIRQNQGTENIDYYFNLLEKSVDKINQSITDLVNHSKNEKVTSQQKLNLRRTIEEVIQSLRFM